VSGYHPSRKRWIGPRADKGKKEEASNTFVKEEASNTFVLPVMRTHLLI